MLLAVILFSACNTETFKKGKDGLEYKIITKGSGSKIKYGHYMQLNFASYYNINGKDSLLNDSKTQGAPIIEMLDSVSTPIAYFEILKQLRKGDSVVIRILTDSAFKKNPEQMPPFFKKGHFIITTLKIVDVFKNKEQADNARAISMVEMEKRDSLQAIAQKEIDEKKLQDYIKKNNIKTVKAPLGTYVEITQEGTGNNIDTGVVVKINYTGKTLEGTVFDSNTDPAKGHVEPLIVNLTNTNNPAFGNPVIPGMKEGLMLLKKGSKGRLYIPSTLGYGKNGSGADIKPNSILVFDIDVLDVMDQKQALAAAAEKNKEIEKMQKMYMDSMQKIKPDASNKK